MTKRELIHIASVVDTDDKITSFVSTLANALDKEISLFLFAWASNGYSDDFYITRDLITETMNCRPYEYIVAYQENSDDSFAKMGDSCFDRMLTHSHLHNIIVKLYHYVVTYGSIENAFANESKKHKNTKFAHVTLSNMFGGNTGLPTKHSSCAFYRYNLFQYWVVHKFRLWKDVEESMILLPCSDCVFENAYKLGVTHNKLKVTLNNAVRLTQKSHDWFTPQNHLNMYDLLAFAKDV